MTSTTPENIALLISQNTAVATRLLGLTPSTWRYILVNEKAHRTSIEMKEPLSYVYRLGQNELNKQKLLDILKTKEFGGIELHNLTMPISKLNQYLLVTYANHVSEIKDSILK